MQKWITDIIQAATFDATRKPKSDIAIIAAQTGYKVANIFRYNDGYESPYAKLARIDGITAGIAKGDFVVYQFPSLNSGNFESYFVNRMHERGIKVICLIHDVDTLRNMARFNEIDYFNRCDVLIVHSRIMGAALRNLGVTTPMVFQVLADYLDDNHEPDRYRSTITNFKREVVFAGNLLKFHAIGDWNYDTPITAFGTTNEALQAKLTANTKVDFRGQRTGWDLIQELPKTFGLAWDSDYYHAYNEYTKYNHPYKVSMYLSHGLPVIVWKEAAVANFIVDNHLGLAIDNLDELDATIQTISDEQISDLLDHVNQFGALIRNGWFTRQALQAAEQLLLFPDYQLPDNMQPYTQAEQAITPHPKEK